jgi:hypothetical protein
MLFNFQHDKLKHIEKDGWLENPFFKALCTGEKAQGCHSTHLEMARGGRGPWRPPRALHGPLAVLSGLVLIL